MDPQNPQQPVQSFTPQVDPPAQTSKFSLWLKILLGAVLIVVIGGGGYFLGTSKNQTAQNANSSLTPQPTATLPKNVVPTIADPTVSWKTYNNSNLEFSFKYPPELIYLYDQFDYLINKNTPSGNLLVQNFDGSKPHTEQPSDVQFVVDVYRNLEKLSLDAYVEQLRKSNNLNASDFQQTTLYGKKALKGVTIQKYQKVPAVWFENKGFMFTLSINTQSPVFDQILQTFKFIPASPAGGDQNQLVDTTNWKTYNYPNFTYSFKAPETYILTINQINDPSIPTLVQSLTLNETNASGGKNDFGILVWNATLETHLKQMAQDNFQQNGTKSIDSKQWVIVNNLVGETQYLIEMNNKTYAVGSRNKILLDQVLSTFKFTN